MATPLMTAFVRIRPDFSSFKQDVEHGVAKSGKASEDAGKKHGKLFGRGFGQAAAFGVAAGLGSNVVIGAGKLLLKTITDARALGLVPLQHQVELTGASWSKFQRQLAPAQKRMENLGFTNADVNKSLTRLVTSTGRTGLSMKALGTAADYARFKHIPLTDAAIALGRAAVGNTRALKDVGIATSDLPKHFSTTGTAASRLEIVMKLLHKRIGGTAVDDAATFGGKLDILKAKLTDASAKVGQALLPAISSLASVAIKYLVPALQSLGTWLKSTGIPAFTAFTKILVPLAGTVLQGFFVGLSAVLGMLGKLPGPVKIAGVAIIGLAIVFANASKIMAAAADINPWFALATAIIVVTGLVIQHWGAIVKVTKRVWGDILRFVQIPFHWLAKYWPLLVSILGGPVGAAAVAIVKHWRPIVAFFRGSWTQIVRVFRVGWTAVRTGLTAAWNAVSRVTRVIWNAIRAYFTAYWRTLRAIFAAAWNALRNALGAAWRAMAGTARSVWNSLRNWFGGWWRGFRSFTSNAVGAVAGVLNRAWKAMHDRAVSVFQTMVKDIGRAWNQVKQTVKTPVNWVITHVINGLIGAFDWVSGKIGGPHINKLRGLASGGRLPGYGGGDRHPALLEGGEAVVPKHLAGTGAFSEWARAHGIPGYATGGRVGNRKPARQGAPPSVTGRFGPQPSGGISGGINIGGVLGGIGHAVGSAFHVLGDTGKIIAAVTSGNSKALTNAIRDMIPHGTGGAVADLAGLLTALPLALLKAVVGNLISLGSAATGSGADIVNYALKFLGKIPYVWGGTAVPGGADCSGFVQGVYKHFGISAPRSSEAQGKWVKRGPPKSGGLAFYHSPPGGPDPGHVAIVKNASTVISQGGGLGPKLMALHGMPLLWTGTPPGGFGAVGGTAGHGLVPANAAAIAAYFRARGMSRAAIAGVLGNIMQESGGNPLAGTNPPGRGLIQILGDPGGSLAAELGRTLAYINANGSIADINRHSPDATAAAVWFSNRYERPGIPQIQNRIASARASYAAGYARGGVITEPIAGVGIRTGQRYTFGESGEETVIPGRVTSGGGQMATLISEVRRLQAITAQQGRDFADVLNGVARRAVR